MWLICGLGNIGDQYKYTRHNAGFCALDTLSICYAAKFISKEKLKGQIAQTVICGQSCFLVKPNTYMNLSGECVLLALNYYKINIANIIVIHDDLDLNLAAVRVKIGGGSAGHNGIKSIDHAIGKNYIRVRIGIARPDRIDISDYVLGKFSRSEMQEMEISYHKIVENFALLFTGQIDKFTNLMAK
jgi:PTH1 family peptidyl-tRNA hydrolase